LDFAALTTLLLVLTDLATTVSTTFVVFGKNPCLSINYCLSFSYTSYF